jgi:hypothetical protein
VKGITKRTLLIGSSFAGALQYHPAAASGGFPATRFGAVTLVLSEIGRLCCIDSLMVDWWN